MDNEQLLVKYERAFERYITALFMNPCTLNIDKLKDEVKIYRAQVLNRMIENEEL